MCGKYALNKIPYEFKHYNAKKILIVCDKITEKTGYLNKLVKAVSLNDIIFTIQIIDAEYFASEKDVDNVTEIYLDGGFEGIIAIGNANVTNVCKAVVTVVADGKKKMVGVGVGDLKLGKLIPLIIVPIKNSLGNEANLRTFIYDMSYNNWYDILSVNCSATAVVFDDRMSEIMPINTQITYGIYAMNMALCASIDDHVSCFTGGYANTAIRLIRETLIEKNKLKDKSKWKNIMLACTLAGIQYGELENRFLSIVTLECSRYKSIPEPIVFNALLPHYLNIFINKSNIKNAELLMEFVGAEEYISVPENKKVEYLIVKLNNIYEEFNRKYEFKYRLSDYGVTNEDLSKILELSLNNADMDNNGENHQIILQMLSRAL